MSAHNPTEEKLLSMYKRICMGNCSTCQSCHATIENLSPPVSAWGVGNNFVNEDKKLLFVGKNARGYFDQPANGNFHEAFDDGRWLWEPSNWRKNWGTSSAYWTYTRTITGKIFGDDSFDHIAFTNLVKCNDSATTDTTSNFVKDNCLKRLKVLSQEIKIIRPTHLIFYTGWKYDGYILRFFFDTLKIFNDARKKIGAKYVPWTTGIATIDGLKIRVLIAGHPQNLKKDSYIKAVSSWVTLKNRRLNYGRKNCSLNVARLGCRRRARRARRI